MLEIRFVAKGVLNLFVSTHFPTLGIALNSLPFVVGVAHNLDETNTARAVETDLSRARRLRTRFLRVANYLTPMHAVIPDLEAFLPTPIGKQLLSHGKTFPRNMALLLAQMRARKFSLAYGTALKIVALVAENTRLQFLPAIAHLHDHLNTGRAIARVTARGALMTAGILLQARASTVRKRLAALNWRVHLGNFTGAEDRLVADYFARLAEIYVAEV